MMHKLNEIFCFILIVTACGPTITNSECMQQIFKFGHDFEIRSFESDVKTEVEEIDNPNVNSEKIRLVTTRSNDEWATIPECPSCNSKGALKDLYLSAKRKLPCGLEAGMSVHDVIKIMGKPAEKKDDDLSYLSSLDGAEEYIFFRFKNGQLSGVQWAFYFD